MAIPSDRRPTLEPLPRRLADRVAKGVRVSFPPAGYDPRDRPDSELAQFALPPRPDRRTAPVAYRNWLRAMTPPLNFPLKPEFTADLFGVMPEPTRLARFGNVRSIGESSRNWSGAYVRPGQLGRMSLVQGTWSVSDTRAPKGSPEYAVSSWVGLDGHDPASRSMPQLGVQRAILTNPADEWLLAWWQWWLKPDPDGLQVVILDVPVAVGDEIYGQVQQVGPAKVIFFINNVTQSQAFSFEYTLPNPWGTGPTPAVLGVEGRTAEWVVERPLVPQHAPRLGDFGEIVFTDCSAAAASVPGGVLNDVSLNHPRLIHLHEWDDRARPGRLASSARREGAESFSMTFED